MDWKSELRFFTVQNGDFTAHGEWKFQLINVLKTEKMETKMATTLLLFDFYPTPKHLGMKYST